MGTSLVLSMWVSIISNCAIPFIFPSMNLFGGITYALLASGDKQPWSTKKISVKYQMQFEVNQLCFRTIDPDEVPILEGESESSDETARENPNFEE